MTEPARVRLLPRLGLRPSVSDVIREELDEAFARAAAAAALPANGAPPGSPVAGPLVDALDAGCGRVSALSAYRTRIRRFVGVDLHRPPAGALPHLDEFVRADVCGESSAFTAGSFDVALSSFTAEHFVDPPAAFRNLRRWLRPGGSVVLTTVNRRHPLVALYLAIPDAPRRPLQRLLKARPADAHPLVGACNDPATIRRALEAAGFVDVRLVTVPHLARAWARRLPAYLLGLLGDLAAQPFPGRRSTIVAAGRVPSER